MRQALFAASFLLFAAPAPAEPPCGPLPGPEPAGPEPELFAPGWVNQGARTRDIAMTPDQREIYFCVMVGGSRHSTIAVTRRGEDGCWREPEIPALFADPRWRFLEPHVAPGGQRLYFVSDRPDTGDAPRDEDIWLAERDGERWGEPRRLPAPVNTPGAEFFPSLERDGSLYFTRRAPDSRREVILRARPDGAGGWREPEELPAEVNGASTQFNAFIDPDGAFLIVCAAGRAGSLGQVDYWLVPRDPATDTWREAVNLGERVNGRGREGWSPYVSPDGRWFFFMSARPAGTLTAPLSLDELTALHRSPGNGLGHMWWLSADVLRELAAAGAR
jgi:hypothetical protein